MVS
ncbi:hypothetical protein YPPY46_1527, partial [Yersinia pestis PY-46]|jgi:hypothetical protein